MIYTMYERHRPKERTLHLLLNRLKGGLQIISILSRLNKVKLGVRAPLVRIFHLLICRCKEDSLIAAGQFK